MYILYRSSDTSNMFIIECIFCTEALTPPTCLPLNVYSVQKLWHLQHVYHWMYKYILYRTCDTSDMFTIECIFCTEALIPQTYLALNVYCVQKLWYLQHVYHWMYILYRSFDTSNMFTIECIFCTEALTPPTCLPLNVYSVQKLWHLWHVNHWMYILYRSSDTSNMFTIECILCTEALIPPTC